MDFCLKWGVFAPRAEYGVGDCGGKWVNGGERWGLKMDGDISKILIIKIFVKNGLDSHLLFVYSTDTWTLLL